MFYTSVSRCMSYEGLHLRNLHKVKIEQNNLVITVYKRKNREFLERFEKQMEENLELNWLHHLVDNLYKLIKIVKDRMPKSIRKTYEEYKQDP